jgi:hypothetical protein
MIIGQIVGGEKLELDLPIISTAFRFAGQGRPREKVYEYSTAAFSPGGGEPGLRAGHLR